MDEQYSLDTAEASSKVTSRFNVYILILFLALLAGFVYYVRTHVRIKPTAQLAPSPTPSPKVIRACNELNYENQTKIELVDSRTVDSETFDRMLLALGDLDFFKKLTDTTQPVTNLQYNDELQKAIYILGDEPSVENKNGFRSAHLYDLKSKEDREILRYQTLSLPTQKAGIEFDRLGDIAFSSDGSEVLITSNKKMWRYNIENSAIQEVYDDQATAVDSVFREPKLSPDKQKILLKIGYYEGASSSVLDLQTRKVTDLPFSGYIEGQLVLGWAGSDLVIERYNENSAEFCLASISGEQKECLFTVEQGYTSDVTLKDNQLTISWYEDKPSGQQVCNNANEPYDVMTRFKHVTIVDLHTKKVSELLSVDATESSGVSLEYTFSHPVKVLIDQEEVFISQLYDHGQRKIVLINKSTPNQLTVLTRK